MNITDNITDSQATAPLSLILLFEAQAEWSQLPAALNVIQHVSTGSEFFAQVECEHHTFKLVGFSQPVPDEAVAHSFDCSHWSQQDKAPLRAHRRHIICTYEGESSDMTEQMVAMYKLAETFIGQGLLGLLDIHAWNCIPLHILSEIVKPENLKLNSEIIPLTLWVGFVKFFETKQDVWFCTKGNDRWGVCDFAYYGKHDQAEEIIELFSELFWYVRESKKIPNFGDTASIGTKYLLKFYAVTEYHDYLETPTGTRVIKEIEQSAIH